MNWQTIDTLPKDYEEVICTDGSSWWKGYVGESYDYEKDRRVYPVWRSIRGQIISGVTHWARIEYLPQ